MATARKLKLRLDMYLFSPSGNDHMIVKAGQRVAVSWSQGLGMGEAFIQHRGKRFSSVIGEGGDNSFSDWPEEWKLSNPVTAMAAVRKLKLRRGNPSDDHYEDYPKEYGYPPDSAGWRTWKIAATRIPGFHGKSIAEVARTITRLDPVGKPRTVHLAEAVQYASFNGDAWHGLEETAKDVNTGYRGTGLSAIAKRALRILGREVEVEGKGRGNPSGAIYAVGSAELVMDRRNMTQQEAVRYLKQHPLDDLGYHNYIYKDMGKFAGDQAWKRVNVRSKRTNPGSGSQSAIAMAESFHGRPYRDVVDVVEEESYPAELAELGKLISLEIIPHDDDDVAIPVLFSRAAGKQVLLASDGRGQNLQLVGGDQEISAKGLGEFGIELNGNGKAKVSLGLLHSVSYHADKHHLEGPKQQEKGMEYYHVFCDEEEGDGDGERPEVLYDCRNKRVELVGGTYTVEDVGIKG